MQFLYYKNKILTALHGNMPTIIFVWYSIFVAGIVLSMTLSISWYYKVYNVVDAVDISSGAKYEATIDTKVLEEMVTSYAL